MTEYEIEPVRGLPGTLPPGETMLWQGAPDPLALARGAFHARSVAIYFAVLTAIAFGTALMTGSGYFGTLATAGCGLAGVALLHGLAWLAARATVYTLTDRRIVLRVGVAVPKCINLPLARIAAIDLSAAGDIAIRLADAPPLGWLTLWPHARPWRLARVEPMLRNVADPQAVAARIARACAAAQPAHRPVIVHNPAPAILLPEAVAA